MKWILQLEDERQLRGHGGDLLKLLGDPEARVRRRSALAVGRARLPEGVAALTPMLQSEGDAEVRQMAAFAMGLIGDASAAPALLAALNDADPLIQGRAAEALGLIGHKPAVQPITNMVYAHVNGGALTGITPDDMGYPKGSAVEAVRLGAYALVRLGRDTLPRPCSIARAARAAAVAVASRSSASTIRAPWACCSTCSTAKGN